MEEIVAKKQTYPVELLSKIWWDIAPKPVETKEYTKEVLYKYGYRLYSKMMIFLEIVKFTKSDWDYYLALDNARDLNEEYPAYKIRQKFQRALLKYNFSVKRAIFFNVIEDAQKKKVEELDKQKEEGKENIDLQQIKDTKNEERN